MATNQASAAASPQDSAPPPAAPAAQQGSPDKSQPQSAASPQAAKDAAFKRDLDAALKTTGLDRKGQRVDGERSTESRPSKDEQRGVGKGKTDEEDDEGDDSDNDEDDEKPGASNEADEDEDDSPAGKGKEKERDGKPQPSDWRALDRREKKVEAREKKHETQTKADKKEIAESQATIDQAIARFQPALAAVTAYDGGKGDKAAAARAIKELFGVPFATIARDLYEHLKMPAGVSALEQQNAKLQARLDKLEGGLTKEKQEASDSARENGYKGRFEKSYQKHELKELDVDNELRDRAYKVWRDSWDPDLNSHDMKPSEAMAQVLDKESKRLERVASRKGGGSAPPTVRREREAPAGTKAYKDMTKDEKRAYDTQLAVNGANGRRADRRA